MRPRDLIARSHFRTRFSPNATRSTVWKGISDYLGPRLGLKSDSRVLELGTGHGSWIRSVTAGERVALDLNPDLPEIFASQGITGVRPIVGSCTKIDGLPDGHFDLILASNLLEHLDLDEALLCVGEMHRLLKPGGQVCIIQPNFALKPRQYFDDFTHRTIFTHESLKDLFESMGFETVRMWKRFMPFSMKSSTARLAFLVPIYLRSPIKPMAGQMCLIARKTRST